MSTPTIVVHPDIVVALPAVAAPVRVDGGNMILDSTVAPYASATVDLPLTADTQLEPLDPNVDTRIVVRGASTGRWDLERTPWVEVRRNLVRSPAARTLDGFSCSPLPLTELSIIPNFGSIPAVRSTRKAAGNARLLEVILGPTVKAGQTVTIKGRTRMSAAGATISASLRPDTTSATDAVPLGSIVAATAAFTFELTGVATKDLGPNGGISFVITAAFTTEAWFDFTQLQVELVAPPLGSYFDGERADTDTAKYEWVGAPDGSPSTAEARGISPGAPPVWQPDPVRVFDLGLRTRAVDHHTKIVTLTLASDEALMVDHAALADVDYLASAGSLRGIINAVLARVIPGRTLEATPADDADITPYWELTNYIGNPSAIGVATGWAAGTGVSAVARIATAGANGAVGFIRATTSAAAGNVRFDTPISVRGGQKYTVSGYVRVSTGAGITAPGIQWLNAAGAVLDTYDAPTVALGTGWVRIKGTAEAPPDATAAKPYYAFAGSAAARSFDVDDTMFTDGERLVPYFDGGSTGGGYTYTIGGAANVSAATRHPVVERDPESLVWRVGVYAWDFLAPLVTSVNRRLFCDEIRRWRLVDPGTYGVDGYIAAGSNAIEGVDIISRDDAAVFCTGVAVRYAWLDADGISRTRTDVAGTPGKVYVVDYAKPYPGPGAAQAILDRRAGTGRTQEVAGLARWEAAPGMYASITLPYAPEQLGTITTTRWALDDTGTMEIGTRGLVDVADGSWLARNPDENWADLDPDQDWDDLIG